MGKRIDDEFTNLPISRQRKRALRMKRDGKCISCGKDLSPRSIQFCETHRLWQRQNELEHRAKHKGNPEAIQITAARERKRKIMAAVKEFRERLEAVL